MQNLEDKHIAFVHDYLLNFGGAERVLASMRGIFPEAPVYALLYDEKAMGEQFPREGIIPSFVQNFPGFLRRRSRYLAPLLPMAVESFDLRDYDVVISSSSAFAKGVVTRARTTHICYCHTPMRFAWDYANAYGIDTREKRTLGPAVRLMQHALRLWDRSSADRVDHFIANSHAVASRIKKYYQRDSAVIYPPVDVDQYKVTGADDGYFLIVSRLVPYKRVDMAIEAFNKLELPLVVAGEGPELRRLQQMAGKTVTVLGSVTEKKKRELMERCTAFVFSGEDDFGIAPVEAMAAGKPVLALRAGGITETVMEGVTGEFFNSASPEALADGIRRLRERLHTYGHTVIRKRAEEFRPERFKEALVAFLQKITA